MDALDESTGFHADVETTSESLPIKRRSFIYGGVSIAVLLALGGSARAIAGEQNLLRPPAGQNQSDFLARCTRCDRCRSVCPTQVIAPAVFEDGFISLRSPKMNFKLGYCNFCEKCAEVCPTGALSRFEHEAFESSAMNGETFYDSQQIIGLAQVNADECIAWVGPSKCKICSEKCPYEAITVDEYERPVVDESRCNGCGVCENLCPSTRLRSYSGGTTRGIEVQPLQGGEGS